MYGLILQYDIKWTTVYLGRLRGVGVIENLATGILHHEMFWTPIGKIEITIFNRLFFLTIVDRRTTKEFLIA
jgi:hypothetical protein